MGPLKLLNPPNTVINTIFPEKVQCRMSGVVRPFSGANSVPATPVKAPETTKADQRYRQTSMPTNWARISLSRIACSAFPHGDADNIPNAAVHLKKTHRT